MLSSIDRTLFITITGYSLAMVTCMDEQIGNIEETLRNRGILDNTLLIFTTGIQI